MGGALSTSAERGDAVSMGALLRSATQALSDRRFGLRSHLRAAALMLLRAVGPVLGRSA